MWLNSRLVKDSNCY